MAWTERVVSFARGAEHAIELGCNFLMLVAGMGLLVLLNVVVVLRYFFATGLNFAPDLTELFFAIFVMAGIAQAARLGVHVATQLLLNVLHGPWRLALVLFIHGVTATVYFSLAWYALQNAFIAHDQTTPVLRIPWSVGYGCLSLGLALVAICSLVTMVRHTLGGEAVKVNLADPGVAVT